MKCFKHISFIFLIFGYYTISAQTPGGVSVDNVLWLKANEGTNTTVNGGGITSWTDYSTIGGWDAAGTGNVVYNEQGINFNPSLLFSDDAKPLYNAINNINRSNGLALTIFTVVDIPSIGDKCFIEIRQGNSRAFLIDRRYASNKFNSHTTGIPVIISVDDKETVSTPSFTDRYENGTFFVNTQDVFQTNWTSNGRYIIGDDTTGNNRFTGDIGEFIVYDRTLSIIERNKVDSYLAIKYGITLAEGTATNYTASNNTVFWTGDITYQNDVFGIGKDATSALEQQISKSVNSDAIITLSTDTDFISVNGNHTSIGTDVSFLMLGNNNASTTFTPYTSGVNVNRIIDRVWKVQETGTLGSIHLKVDTSIVEAEYILVSTDPTFATGVTETALTSGEVSIDLVDGTYFTFGSVQIAPGGVITDLELWFRPEEASTPASWTNISNGLGAITGLGMPSIGAISPVFNSLDLNFNGGVLFDKQGLQGEYNATFTGTLGALSAFTVGSMSGDNSNNTKQRYFSMASGNGGSDENTSSMIPFYGVRGNRKTIVTFRKGTGSNFRGRTDNVIGITDYKDAPYLMSTHFENNENNFYTNSNNPYTATYSDANLASTRFSLGTSPNDNPTNPMNGTINELILYKNVLSSTDRNKVDSYLAIKYGITLSEGVATNYTNSDDTVFWTGDTTYQYDVFGIGKDTNSGLEQQISKSINTDALVTLSTDTDFYLANGSHSSIGDNLSFLMIGNNDGSILSFLPLTESPSNVFYRVAREWKVQESGTLGIVNLMVTESDLPAFPSTGAQSICLLVDDDANFTNARAYQMTKNGGQWEIQFDFSGTEYFTFGYGCVEMGDLMRHGKSVIKGEENPYTF